MHIRFSGLFHRLLPAFLLMTALSGVTGAVKAQLYISTAAGTPRTSGSSGDGGPATAAQLRYPNDVAVDAAGNLYIADYSNHAIRRVDAVTGIITTIAGNGSGSPSGDGGPAVNAGIGGPWGIDIDAAGNLYISDQDYCLVRKINTAGIISTVAGNSSMAGQESGDGGPATQAGLGYPNNVAVDAAGNIYISDYYSSIRKVDAVTGKISTVTGKGSNTSFSYSGPASGAQLNQTNYMAIDGAGNLYVADVLTIRKIDVSGNMTTVAGNGAYGSLYNYNGPATKTSIQPNAVVVDASGNLYISDQGSASIRKVDASGNMSLYAGNGTNSYGGDGGLATGSSAALSSPYGMALDAAGSLYIAEPGNYIVRRIGTLSAQTITFAPITKIYGEPDFVLTGTASSGLPVTYTVTDPTIAKVNGDTIHLAGPGTTTIIAYQNGSSSFQAAPPDTVILQVNAPNQAITGLTDITKTYGSADFALTAVASSGLPVTYAIADPTIATITGGVLHILQAGITTITATQPGNGGTFTLAVPVTITLTVTQDIAFVDSLTKTYGDGDFTLTAIAADGQVVSYTIADPAVAAITGQTGNTVHILNAGVTTIAASEAGASPSAPPVKARLIVNPAPLTITADNQTKYQGTDNPPLTVSYSGFVNDENNSILLAQPTAVTIAITNSPAGTYPITVSSAVSPNYIFTYLPGTLTVNPAPVAVTSDKLDAAFTGSTLQVVLESLKTESASLQVMDITGRVLFSEQIILNGGVNTYTFPASNIAHGAYIVLARGNGLKLTDKIIK
jgi:sugar lactone lactonase YvrE